MKSCQGTRVGDAVDPAYLDNIVASAVINDAVRAYDEKRYKEALDIYRGVLGTGQGRSTARLQRHLSRERQARQARRRRRGLRQDRRFRAGEQAPLGEVPVRSRLDAIRERSAGEWPVRDVATPGATHTAKASACLDIVGHTSASGSDPVNERISLQRAQYVKQRLDADAAALKAHTKAIGMGSQENLIGRQRRREGHARPQSGVQGRRLRLAARAANLHRGPPPHAGREILSRRYASSGVVSRKLGRAAIHACARETLGASASIAFPSGNRPR